ncbi:MAG: methyltransferase domain-containing protein [Anaerolineae bacterium]|nr:methyltransferase domain-containing protein [Anaerolineae bacterium]
MAALTGAGGSAFPPGWGLAFLTLAALGLLAYWALVLSEGAYLGPRAVAWLYDRAAGRYDRIKNPELADDAHHLARPLLLMLEEAAAPRLLDVGTGTGRLPLALMAQRSFRGQIVGADRSPGMLAQAQRKLGHSSGRCGLALADAEHLPFAAAQFDAVTCLEVLEFTARPRHTLCELLRVLKPGGVLVVTNRVGWDALWYPGRLCGRGRVEAALRLIGAEVLESERWQTYYDLIWARKGGVRSEE